MGWLNNLLDSGRNPDSMTSEEFYEGFNIPCKRRSDTATVEVGEDVNLWSNKGEEIRVYSRKSQYDNDLFIARTQFDKLAKHLQEKREYTAIVTEVTSNRIHVDVNPESPETTIKLQKAKEEEFRSILLKPINLRSSVIISFSQEPFNLKPSYTLKMNPINDILNDTENLNNHVWIENDTDKSSVPLEVDEKTLIRLIRVLNSGYLPNLELDRFEHGSIYFTLPLIK